MNIFFSEEMDFLPIMRNSWLCVHLPHMYGEQDTALKAELPVLGTYGL